MIGLRKYRLTMMYSRMKITISMRLKHAAITRTGATGRPMPTLSARVNVRFGDFKAGFYAMSGSPDEIAAEVDRFAELGVEHLAVAFGETDPDRVASAAERFDREIVARHRVGVR